MAPPSKRQLPPKESTLFKEVLSFYETKALKKGLKAADQILKKFPEHGETTVMKGLILTHMGRREEGHDLVKKGVRLDLTSHICWHVFGLVQKGEKKYEEALKSYAQALKFDKDNMNILRDAAHLQTQLRLYNGLIETRMTLLKLRPNTRVHWIGLAVAYRLNGQFADARQIMESYAGLLVDVPDYDVEHSEATLFHVRILEDMGATEDALALLDLSAKSRAIVDRAAIMEIRARLLTKSKSSEATHAWAALIESNPDCYDYYKGFFGNRGVSLDSITDEHRADTLKVLREYSEQIPRAAAPRRLALNIATGNEFKELVTPYLLSGLNKGVPSLFVDLKALLSDTSKLEVIETIAEEHRQSLVKDGSTPEPTTYLWTLYFLAQHHSTLGHYEKALEIVNTALEHTPTLPELLTCKARIFKRAGDLVRASATLDEARALDGQDRFLNTKSGKYRLRAGFIDEALEVLGMFTKKDAPSAAFDLEEMQSLLYLVEAGRAHAKTGKSSLALKKYIAIQKIFDEIEDDQYDFHGYSLRKFTINIYLDMLAWEDRIRSHPALIASAVGAAQIYIAVHDDPSLANPPVAGLTDAEKKAKKKAKKAAQKKEEDAAKKPPAPSANEDKGLEPAPPKDDDPEGMKLIAVSDPLEQAAKLLSPISKLAKESLEYWLVVFDVAVRRKKYLQAARALSCARALDAESPEIHFRAIDLSRRTITATPDAYTDAPGAVLKEVLAEILPGDLSLEAHNSEFLQRHPGSVGAIIACAKASHALETLLAQVEEALFSALKEPLLNVKDAQEVLSTLTHLKSSRVDEFRVACDSKFTLATVFKTPEELATIKKEAEAAPAEAATKEDGAKLP